MGQAVTTRATSAGAPRTNGSGASRTVTELVPLALEGLTRMYAPDAQAFPQTVRAVHTPAGVVVRPEGESLRYTAIAALGLATQPEDVQRQVLAGSTAAGVATAATERAERTDDVGSVALAVWAAVETGAEVGASLWRRLESIGTSTTPITTVECSWAATALAASDSPRLREASRKVTARLTAVQGPGGLFPHTIPARHAGRLRAHVGCFADQVYPIQALARVGHLTGDTAMLARADDCAAAICDLQGRHGQWWWHYDSRARSVVEGYPVYSVHQHAMAPMALSELAELGGADHADRVTRGVEWLDQHPEVLGELISPRHAVVWRKVGRREPPKAARVLSAGLTSLAPRARIPAVDRVLPPTRIDYECRPYELGWLLYAWGGRGTAALKEESS